MVFIFVTIGVLSLLALLLFFYKHEQKRNEQSMNRRKVFCEEIRKGMTMAEIRPILAKYGEYGEVPELNDITPLDILIIYENPEAIERFGGSGIYLYFDEERLSGVLEFIPGDMDAQRSICGDQ